MQHILYTIHSKWDWNESKMLIEFLSLNRQFEYGNGLYYAIETHINAFCVFSVEISTQTECVPSYLHLQVMFWSFKTISLEHTRTVATYIVVTKAVKSFAS